MADDIRTSRIGAFREVLNIAGKYLNDHFLIEKDGEWHFFGIVGTLAPDGKPQEIPWPTLRVRTCCTGRYTRMFWKRPASVRNSYTSSRPTSSNTKGFSTCCTAPAMSKRPSASAWPHRQTSSNGSAMQVAQ